MPKEIEGVFRYMGVTDSKLLAPARREHYAKVLKFHPHVLTSTIVVPASTLDSMMKKKSLNDINAEAAIKLLQNFNSYIDKAVENGTILNAPLGTMDAVPYKKRHQWWDTLIIDAVGNQVIRSQNVVFTK